MRAPIVADRSVSGAARSIAARAKGLEPRVALILGSGLGGLAKELEVTIEIAFAEVPGFPKAGVSGHAGIVALGMLEKVPVIAFAGRFHLYEGHSPETAALPVRVSHALGARTLFVSNAAGGIRRSFKPGDLMLITDHINLMFRNPLIGAVRDGELRFPDMSAPYDAGSLEQLRASARELSIPVHEGVYAGLLGPTYETPSEVRMLEKLGADAVGMSTVPEVIVARALGMRVAGVSCVTNAAAGLGDAKLDHAEVLEATARSAAMFKRLVRAFVRRQNGG